MDWFNDLGVYLTLMPQSQAFAFDLATNPQVDPEHGGFDIPYHMQNMPETVSPYPGA